MKILLVEDEPSVAAFLHQGLTEQDYTVDLAADGLLGLRRAQSTQYDCLILDQMLPGLSGLEVCRQVRAHDPGVPILMLTALGETDDKIRGLDAGADDYLVKPFAFDELLARLRALVRRRTEAPASKAVLRLSDLSLDPSAKRVERAGQLLQLTAREFSLLEYLLRNQGRVVSRADLLALNAIYYFMASVIQMKWSIDRDNIMSALDGSLNRRWNILLRLWKSNFGVSV